MPASLYEVPLLDQVRQLWRRRRRLIAIGFAVPLAIATGLAIFLPRQYRSTALVVVERGAGVDDDDVDARLAQLRSENLRRSRLRALIAGYDLYSDQGNASAEVLIDRMQRDIRTEVDKEERGGRSLATTVHVSYSGRDPRVTAQVANELAAFYEREDLRIREQRAEYRREKLKSQLAEARQQLDEQANRLRDYKLKHLNELPEAVGLHLAALEQLNSQIRASRSESGAPHRDGSAQRAAGTPEPEPERDERVARLHELETHYTPDHPDVKRLKREIAMLPLVTKHVSVAQQSGAISIEQAEADNAGGNKARVENIQRNVEALKQSAASHEQGILNSQVRQQELEALLPDYTAARTRYQSLSEKYEIAELSDPKHDGGGLRVLDPAVPRSQPIAPNVLRILAIGVGGAFAVAAAITMAAERMDTSFHTLSDLRTFTRLPVLATLPRLASRTETRRKARKGRDFAAVLVLIVACILIAMAWFSRGTPSLVAWLVQSRA